MFGNLFNRQTAAQRNEAIDGASASSQETVAEARARIVDAFVKELEDLPQHPTVIQMRAKESELAKLFKGSVEDIAVEYESRCGGRVGKILIEPEKTSLYLWADNLPYEDRRWKNTFWKEVEVREFLGSVIESGLTFDDVRIKINEVLERRSSTVAGRLSRVSPSAE